MELLEPIVFITYTTILTILSFPDFPISIQFESISLLWYPSSIFRFRFFWCQYPHLSAAQIKDWLLECFPDFDVGDSTTRLYVNQIREEYQIPKTRKIRHYESVEEQPMGKQMQVDWGETKQKTEGKKEIKLLCICFVLSHSHYKYIEWQDHLIT